MNLSHNNIPLEPNQRNSKGERGLREKERKNWRMGGHVVETLMRPFILSFFPIPTFLCFFLCVQRKKGKKECSGRQQRWTQPWGWGLGPTILSFSPVPHQTTAMYFLWAVDWGTGVSSFSFSLSMVSAQEYSWNELGPTMELREKDLVLIINHASGQASMIDKDQGVANFFSFTFLAILHKVRENRSRKDIEKKASPLATQRNFLNSRFLSLFFLSRPKHINATACIRPGERERKVGIC